MASKEATAVFVAMSGANAVCAICDTLFRLEQDEIRYGFGICSFGCARKFTSMTDDQREALYQKWRNRKRELGLNAV